MFVCFTSWDSFFRSRTRRILRNLIPHPSSITNRSCNSCECVHKMSTRDSCATPIFWERERTEPHKISFRNIMSMQLIVVFVLDPVSIYLFINRSNTASPFRPPSADETPILVSLVAPSTNKTLHQETPQEASSSQGTFVR